MTNSVEVTSGKVIKTAVINCSTAGDNEIVAAVLGARLKVSAFVIQALGNVAVKWKDGTATDLTGAFSFRAREGLTVAVPAATFALGTSPGNSLVLHLSGNIGVVGFVTYWDDDAV